MTGRTGKAVALAAVVAFAALASANGLDRAAAVNGGVASWVPQPLRAEAYRAQAEAALRAGEFGAAELAARQAINADPVDPRSAALLGASRLAAGRPAAADQAFRVAARFGWRDPLTQLYFMDAALNDGQPRMAALRLDALLRQAPYFPVRDMLLARFTATEAGRQALAERLALRPAWLDAFLGGGADLPVAALEARAGVAEAIPGERLGCARVAPLVTRLVNKGSARSAKQLWLAQCPAAAKGIADPGFAAAGRSSNPTPFEWNLAASGDVSAAPAAAPQSGLLARLSAPASRPIAWQMLVLEPGRYRLTGRAVYADGTMAKSFALSLPCRFGDRTPLEITPGKAAGSFSADVEVDAACSGRYLTLWLTPAGDEVRFDAFAIEPLR